MKAIKRGLLITILVILFSLNVLAVITPHTSMYLNLTRTKVSPNQNFDGYLNISFKEPISTDSDLVFYVNGRQKSFPINWLFRNIQNKVILPSKYETSGNSISSQDIIFNNPGSKIVSGIDLTSTSSSSIEDISEFNLTFSGSVIGNSYPSLKVDIGNDGVVDYQYQGDIIQNQFDDIPNTAITSNNPSGTRELKGQQQDTVCEKIYINKPSKSYKIFADTKKLVNGAALFASIKKDDPSINDCVQEKCCEIHPGFDIGRYSCNLDYQINDPGDYYVCLTAFGGSTTALDTTYYQIGVDNNPSKISGYYNSNPSNIDYFIFVKAQKFNDKLNGQVKVNLDPSIINDYLSHCNTSSCLLIPINISSNSKGKITLSNINLKYVDSASGTATINQVTPINYLAESINYTGKTLVINLNDLENLTAPQDTANSLRLYTQLMIYGQPINSNEVQFDDVQGPIAHIKYSTNTPGLNDEVTFDSSYSEQASHHSINKSYWDFGDGNSSEGVTVKHSYSNLGNYTVKLIIIDSQGLIGQDRISVSTQQSSSNLQTDIAQTYSILDRSKKNIAGLSSQVKDTADILGLTRLLSSLESNITSKNASITNIINGGQSLQDKEAKLRSLRTELLQLRDDIPLGLTVTISTFNPKIINLDQIPSDIKADQKSIFKAQENLDVSGEARVVSIDHFDRAENFILVKKKVKSGSGDFYEILPSSASIKSVLTPGYVKVSDNILKFSQSEFYYTLDGTSVKDGLNTLTIVVPSTLPKVDESVDNSQPARGTVDVSKPISPIIIISVTLVVILLIIYFGLFFKGGFLNKMFNKKPFKSEKEYQSLLIFVKTALSKGIKEEKIIEALKKKNWTDQQISVIFNEIHKSRKR